MVLDHPNHLVPGEAQTHEDEEGFGSENAGLVRAQQGKLPQGGTEEVPSLSVHCRRILYGSVVILLDFGHFFPVTLDALEE